MNVKIDSRKVIKGDAFLALRGVTKDGHNYIEDAIERGASLVIAEEGTYKVQTVLVEDTRAYLLEYLKVNYWPQIKDMKLIGVTGTNGKTTTCFLLYEALLVLGKKCAYIGTIGFYMDKKIKDLDNTTPDILDLYEMMLEAKEAGYEYIVMEVSSHALSFHRVDTLLFDYAIFTNLTQDHLDFHKTMESYAEAKKLLFTKLKKGGKAIVNADDPYCDHFLLEENDNITYGTGPATYQIQDIKLTDSESAFIIEKEKTKYSFKSKLTCKYNVYNMLCALIVLLEEKFTNLEEIIYKLEAPVGRMDKIHYNDNTIIIDYAHTPDAVENVLKNMRDIVLGKLYVIVGCGGNRDKTKRPIMAHIAASLSDYAIFTSDNPRWENPETILNDMTSSLEETNYEVIVNRKEAIKKGMQMLEKNDILLLLGKGHENYQIINGEKSYFDDKQIVLEYM